jgi:hypothetical protein
MRQAYEVPLGPEPQKFSVQLAGVPYICRVQWNAVAQCWMLDLADSDDAAIISGIPIVTGIDLLGQYQHLGLGGSLLAQTDYDPDAVPTFENLGTAGRLYFISEA